MTKSKTLVSNFSLPLKKLISTTANSKVKTKKKKRNKSDNSNGNEIQCSDLSTASKLNNSNNNKTINPPKSL